MKSEKVQVTDQQGRNSDALNRDGDVCSSEESAVMAEERRNIVIQLKTLNNW